MLTRIIRLEPRKKPPCWKDPKDYETLNNLELDQWAWEFLKRNPKYVEFWEKFSKGLTEEQKRGVPCPFALWLAQGVSVPLELCDATIWGLPYGYLNPDPNIEYRNIPFIPLGGKEAGMFVSGGFKGTMVIGMPDFNTGEALLEFNFNQPITPQIEVAKKELLKLQAESKKKGGKIRKAFKPRRDEWILLIRILDATAAGIKPKAIAEAFYPDEEITSRNTHRIKEISDKLKQAKRYASHDYRLIPFFTK